MKAALCRETCSSLLVGSTVEGTDVTMQLAQVLWLRDRNKSCSLALPYLTGYLLQLPWSIL